MDIICYLSEQNWKMGRREAVVESEISVNKMVTAECHAHIYDVDYKKAAAAHENGPRR